MQATGDSVVVLLGEEEHIDIPCRTRPKELTVLFRVVINAETRKGSGLLVLLRADIPHLHLLLSDELTHPLIPGQCFRLMALH